MEIETTKLHNSLPTPPAGALAKMVCWCHLLPVLKYQWAARPRGRSAAPLEAFLGSSDMSETGRRSQAPLCCVHVFNVLQSFVFVLRSRTFSFVVIISAKFYYLSVFFLLGNDIHTYCFI